ncbi:MAG: hypothetical protein K8W52_45535 [Deltaproteobacteria bacterium]|nr:hypothetical protein [Deltaproteobacteria bacterium]
MLVATPARADDAADARALFGLHEPAPEVAPACAEQDFGCVFADDPIAAFAPAALTSILDGAWLRELPTRGATHDDLARYANGTGPDPRGLVVPGATALEQRWQVDGAPSDDLRTGTAGTAVPVEFVESIAVTTGGFSARDGASTGALIDARLRGGDRSIVDSAAWFGLAAPDRHAAPVRYAPLTATVETPAAISASAVVGGHVATLAGARVWALAGIRPSLAANEFTRVGERLVDRNADGAFDRDRDGLVTEEIGRATTTRWSFDVPLVARVGADRGPHALALTAIGTWSGTPSVDPLATPDAGALDDRRVVGDLIATWRGRWPRTRAQLQWAWHRDQLRQHGADELDPQINTAFVPSASVVPDDFAVAVGCDDGAAADPYALIPNCPLSTGYYARGGVGLLTDVTADRPSLTGSIAHVLGEHRLEVGLSGEDARLRIDRRYTGGYLRRSLFGVDEIDTRFVELGTGPGFTEACADDGSEPCRFLDRSTVRYRTRSAAVWLTETWRPGEGIAVEVGLRGEVMQLGDAVDLRALLPRIGAAWDPLGGGRSRIFVGWGRAMPHLPGRLAELVDGGPTELTTVTIPQGTSRFLDVDRGLLPADGLAPMLAEDVTAGAEVALARAVRMSITGHARILRRGLDRDGVLLVGPGAAGGTAADRRSGEHAIELATSPSAPVALHLGYLYARARGNWNGPADPGLGATYYTSGELAGAPTTGDLSSDLRHRFFAEVVTSRHVRFGELRIAGRAAAASGRPLGAFDGGGTVIIARGPLGRTPPVTSANVRVALRRGALEVGLEVTNLFDRRTPTTIDERYTTARIRPIVGGRADDLVFARDDDGTVVAANRGYGRATRFASAMSGLVYARLALR